MHSTDSVQNMSDLNVTINSSELSDNSSDYLTNEHYIADMANIIVRPILVLFGTIGKSFDYCEIFW